MTNLQDIIPDREIIKLQNEECLGLVYESWVVAHPVFSDQVETLLEKGFMVSTSIKGELIVNKQLNPSPEKLHENKQFWRTLHKTLSRKGLA